METPGDIYSDLDAQFIERAQATLPPGAILHVYTPELADRLAGEIKAATAEAEAKAAKRDAAPAPAPAPAPLSADDLAALFAAVKSVAARDISAVTRETPMQDIAVHLGEAIDVIGQVAAAVDNQETDVQRNVCARAAAALASLAARLVTTQFSQEHTANDATSSLALMHLIQSWSERYSDGPFFINSVGDFLTPSTVAAMDTVMDDGSHAWLVSEAARMRTQLDTPPAPGTPEAEALAMLPADVRARMRAHLDRLAHGELPYGWRSETSRDEPQQRFALSLLLRQNGRPHALGVSEYAYAYLVDKAKRKISIIEQLLADDAPAALAATPHLPSLGKARRKQLKQELVHLEPIGRGELPWGFYRVIDSVAESAPQDIVAELAVPACHESAPSAT